MPQTKIRDNYKKKYAPKKFLGQNFLVNKKIIKEFIKTAGISKKDTVLEIGAGTGIISSHLARKANKVIAVEIDTDLETKLRKSLIGERNVELKFEDILKFNLETLPKDYKAVGAIPYQITSPLIHKLTTADNPPQKIALIVQFELAKKICAKPPNATYLSNFVSLFGNAKLVKKVKKNAFRPIPKVDSAILILERTNTRNKNLHAWSRFLHKGFSHPRKMLKSVIDEKLLIEAGINPRARAQELMLEEWKKLFKLKCHKNYQHI